jgi:hypothetical protein
MTTIDADDLRKHALTPEVRAVIDRAHAEKRKQRKPAKKASPRFKFITVPWFWFERLSGARHSGTAYLALCILHLNWRKKEARFPLPTAMFGISRSTKSRALTELEKLGLIRVERRPRRAPVVTVIREPAS